MRDVITVALRGRLSDFRLFWVAQPELAVTRVLDLLPHLIFVDDALGGAAPAQLVKQLVQAAPASPILVLVAENAVATARPSIVAGARSFITKPINEIDFASNLREILAQKGAAPGRDEAHGTQAATMGRIITFVAPKGGTGRTSTAVNTSIALHQATKRSLVLVDADFAAPSVDVALNLRDDHDLTDLLPRLAQFDQELASGILAQHASGIRVLLAPPPAEQGQPHLGAAGAAAAGAAQAHVRLGGGGPGAAAGRDGLCLFGCGRPDRDDAAAGDDGAAQHAADAQPVSRPRVCGRQGIPGDQPRHHAGGRVQARDRETAQRAHPAHAFPTTRRWLRTASTAACRTS